MTSAATAARTHFLQFAIQWSSIVLLYYDWALTFPAEVKYLWRDKKFMKLSTLLYFLCRYALPANVLYLLAVSNKLGSSCNLWYKIIGVISVLGRAAVVFTFLMRTYVVCAKSKIVFTVLGAMALTVFICDIIHVPGLRCKGSSSIQIANNLLAIMVCVFEASATLLTFLRGMQAIHFGGGTLAVRKNTFNYLVIEQGILYFALVSCFTVGAAVLNFRAPSTFFQRLLNAYTLPLSGLLTARFILRVRAYSSTHTPEHSTDAGPQLSTFAAGGGGVTDEFGVDPVSMVFRSGTGSNSSASARQADVEAFLNDLRRGTDWSDYDEEFVQGSSKDAMEKEGFSGRSEDVRAIQSQTESEPEKVADAEVGEIRAELRRESGEKAGTSNAEESSGSR